jgi:hypothetical protein
MARVKRSRYIERSYTIADMQKDFIYYWQGNKLFYYGTVKGTGKTLHFNSINEAEKHYMKHEKE